MRKAVIAVLAALVFVFASCEHRHFQGAEAVEPSPAPTHFSTEVPDNFLAATPAPQDQVSIDVSYVNTQIDSGVISIDLPDFLTAHDTEYSSSVFRAGGTIFDEDYISYDLNIYKFYRQEDSAASLSSLYEKDKSSAILQYGRSIEYFSLLPPAYFGDGTGYITKIAYNGTEIYTGVYNVGDSYYQIVLHVYGKKSSHDIALHMLYSVKLNRDAAAALSGSFAVDLSGGVYKNQSHPVISMPCPDGWQPAESLRFTMPDSILSMSTSDGLGTITVRCYSKDMIEAMSSIFIYDERMQWDLISRGLLKESDIPSIQTIQNEDERAFTIYPSDIIIIHFDLEDSYGYYCVEMIYTGDNPRVYSQMLEIGQGVEVSGD